MPSEKVLGSLGCYGWDRGNLWSCRVSESRLSFPSPAVHGWMMGTAVTRVYQDPPGGVPIGSL